MNKQEVIDKLKAAIPKNNVDDYQMGEVAGLNFALLLLAELEEPEKSVLPQFIADWLEFCKENLGFSLSSAMSQSTSAMKAQPHKVQVWFNFKNNQETFAKAWIYGYEVQKEKLYTVEIPNPNSAGGKLVLSKQQSTGSLILEMLNSDINKPKYLHLTEDEIKKDFGWAWQFAEEVEQCNQER